MISLKLKKKITFHSKNYLKNRNWFSNNLIILNILGIILGIIKIFPLRPSQFGNYIGIIQILCIFLTMSFILWIILDREQKYPIAQDLRKKGQYYLLSLSLSLSILLFTNHILSNSYEPTFPNYFFIYLLKYSGYFLLYSAGIVFLVHFNRYLKKVELITTNSLYLANNSLKNSSNNLENTIEKSKESTKDNVKKNLKFILKLIYAFMVSIIFIYFSVVMIFGRDLMEYSVLFGLICGIIGIIIIPNSLFFSFIMISQMLFLSTLIPKKFPKLQNITIFSGYFLFFILFMPIFYASNTINYGMIEFSETFDANWSSKIPETIEDEFFLEVPFDLSAYMLGIPVNPCKTVQDVLYYQDESIQLYFDAFLPSINSDQLPGQNSTLIRVHGGGWVAGDKGQANSNQINHYFAAQGYIVFDIQYGLIDVVPADLELIAYLDPPTDSASNLKGNFTIDDLVNHLGIFTKYLAEHASEYGANLDSVFLSGGSAGGQLITAMGLAMQANYRPEMFDNNLTIKGIIPYYPAIKYAEDLFAGDTNFIDPTQLVSEKSPPCLIFHGENDGIVFKEVSESLHNAYLVNNNSNCMLYLMPFGGHNAVMNFAGVYSQIFTYFMERFMYLYR